MAAPKNEIIQIEVNNPHASMPLYIPVLVVCNTADEQLAANVRHNAQTYADWIKAVDPHDGVAVMIGGGASVADHLSDIWALQAAGATVFAMNAASQWARLNGIAPDYQVICDAKKETAALVDGWAPAHLFASQCHPDTTARAPALRLWHLETGNVERDFPEHRRKRGGYALIGGGASVGNSALCVAYAMGYRQMHIFGYDSSHRDGRSHAYEQPMNQFIPCTKVKWAGREYTVSVAMKAQAEKFQITAQALKQSGCSLTVYGDGLLQAMYGTRGADLGEREKYQLMWEYDVYRENSPGEAVLDRFLAAVKPDGLIVDFGCGTGRAALRMAERGHEVFLVDFADNSRDEEAAGLPFLQWDLTLPCPVSAPYGYCTDVMEHIPPANVDDVIRNIMASAATVFFQISTEPDDFGALIGAPLHLTVQPSEWWQATFKRLGYALPYVETTPDAVIIIAKRIEA